MNISQLCVSEAKQFSSRTRGYPGGHLPPQRQFKVLKDCDRILRIPHLVSFSELTSIKKQVLEEPD